MSEFPHTTGQIDPTQYGAPVEVTQEQILNASAEDIIMAANNEIARLQALQPTVEHGGIEWKGIRGQLAIVGQVDSQARKYKNASSYGGYKSFGQYLTEQMDDADTTGDLEALDAYQKVESWFDNQASISSGGVIGDVLRSKQEQQTIGQQPTTQPETQPASDPEAEAAQQKQAVEDARRSVEQAHSIELFDDIVKLGKNRTQLNTDVNGGFKDIGDDPSTKVNIGVVPESFKQRFNRKNRTTDWRQELNEVVMFSDVVEQEQRTVTLQHQEKGRFGRTHTTEYTTTETVPGSEHPKMIRNELTGQDEPAVRFRYQFKYGDKAIAAANQGELPWYQEFGGSRLGQHVIASLELPKSVADQLRGQVQQAPQSVRTLVEKLFLSNSNGSMTEQSWFQGNANMQHPVRPPYEQLPAGWNMAIVTSQETVGGSRPNTLGYSVERAQT